MQTHKGLYQELASKNSHCHHCNRSEVRASSLGVQSIDCGYSKLGEFPYGSASYYLKKLHFWHNLQEPNMGTKPPDKQDG